MNTCFVFSDKIRKLSSIKFWKHFLQLFSGLYPYPFLASVNMSGIHLAELLCIFKIHFKVKCTRNNDMSKAFAYHEASIWHHFNFWDIWLICYSHSFASQKFSFSLKIPYHTLHFSLFSKNLHYRMTEFCTNFST